MGCKNEELDLIPGRTKTFFLLQNVQNGSGVHPASYAVGMRGTFQAYHLLTSYTKVKSGSVPLFQHTFLACAETTLPTFPLLRIVCNVWDIFHILSDEKQPVNNYILCHLVTSICRLLPSFGKKMTWTDVWSECWSVNKVVLLSA